MRCFFFFLSSILPQVVCAYITTLIFFLHYYGYYYYLYFHFYRTEKWIKYATPPDTLFINFVNCSCYEEIAQHANLLIIIRIWRRKGSSLPSLFNLQPPHAHQLSLFLSLALSLSRSTGLSLCPFNLGVLLVTDFVFYTTIQLMCYTFIYIHATTKNTHTH